MAVAKNEADVIEASVRHNLAFLDRFIVLDDGSVDDTRRILGKLSQELPRLIVRDARHYGSTQTERMTALLKEETAASRPDFVVLLDADEFLDPGHEADLSARLQAIPRGGVGLYPWATFVLTPDALQTGSPDILPGMRRRRREEKPQFHKAILHLDPSSASDIVVEEGNHAAHAADGSALPSVLLDGLRLLHFPVRSRDQYLAKSVIPWMRFLMRYDSVLRDQANWHWQASFERIAEGRPWDEESLFQASMFYLQDTQIVPRSDWESDLVEEPFLLRYERRYSSGAYLPALAMIARSWQESILREQEAQALQSPQQPPQPLGDRYIALLSGLARQGRTQEALAFLDKELAKGESCELRNIRSTIQFSLGETAEAEQGYRRAMELDPEAKEPVMNLLRIFLGHGRMGDAIPLLETTQHLLSAEDREVLRQVVALAPRVEAEHTLRIIYDVGANNGDDIPYYLLKADRVIAIEANPALVAQIRHRFAAEIQSGRVVVEAVVVTVDEDQPSVPFYIHRGYHVLSQFGEPPASQIDDFDRIELPSRQLTGIIAQHGDPYYIKLDVEGYDQALLTSLFRQDIFPPYLSAESHSIDVFATLVANGHYPSFKIVDGPSIPAVYGRHTIATARGPVPYSFPDHSAGPFGDDIPGQWQTPAAFLHTLAHHDLGWKDIHVSRVDQPAA
jgi:FkbM family methyltransferase